MDMFDFSMLSLDDVFEIPKLLLEKFEDIEDIEDIEVNEDIESIQMIDETFDYSGYTGGEFESDTMEELLINLSLYEDSTISFEELRGKLIEFYRQEATEDLLVLHLSAIDEITPDGMLDTIYENIAWLEHDENNSYRLKIIIEFISSPFGNEYLNEIYNTKCIY